MADTRNRQTLLGGGGGEERAGAAEENPLQLSLIQLIQKISAQCDRAAATPGTSRMDILHGVVKHQGAAVRQLSAKGQTVPFAQFQQNLLADLTQVTGDDQVKILRFSVQILHMGLNGVKCSRGRCQV